MNQDLLTKIYRDLDSILQKDHPIYIKHDKKCLCNISLYNQPYNDIFYNKEGLRCCYNCGFVYDNISIDHTAEWNIYSNDDSGKDNTSQIRCSSTYKNLKGNDVLCTYISNINMNCNRKYNKNLIKYNIYTNSDNSTELYKIKVIKQLLTELNIDIDIINNIIKQYFSLNKIYRGNIKLGIIAALTYINYKNINQTKTLKSISTLFGIELQIISKALNEITQDFNNNNDNTHVNVNVNCEFVESFCKSLFLYNSDILNGIKKIFKACIELGICSSSTPQALSSSVIMFVSNKKNITIDMNILINISGLTIFTIKKYYKEIETNEQLIFNYIKNLQIDN